MPSSSRTCLLYPLPLECTQLILGFTNDLELSIRVESLVLNLPALHPNDALSAFNQFPTNTPFFSVSKRIAANLPCTKHVDAFRYANYVAQMSEFAMAWMYRFGPKPWTEKCTSCLAWYGRLPMLQWLHQQDSQTFSTSTMNQAAMRGHLDIVKFLHEHRSEGCTTHGIDSAARNGHLDIIRFLHENRSEGCTTSAMDNAAGYGHFEIVKFLHYSRSEGCTKNALENAASEGFLEIVKFLSEINSKGNRIKEL